MEFCVSPSFTLCGKEQEELAETQHQAMESILGESRRQVQQVTEHKRLAKKRKKCYHEKIKNVVHKMEH
jgi:hypothetical protein